MNFDVTKELNIKNINQCSQQTKEDIEDLTLSVIALVIYARKQQILTSFGSIFSHTLGIANGIHACVLAQHNNKILVLVYAFFMIFWAKFGFIENDLHQSAKQELYESMDQYNRLKEILNKTNSTQINDIAKIYRKHVVDIDNVNPEDVKNAMRKIILKYER